MSEGRLTIVFIIAVLAWALSACFAWVAVGALGLSGTLPGILSLGMWIVISAPVAAILLPLFGGFFRLGRSVRIASLGLGLPCQILVICLVWIFN